MFKVSSEVKVAVVTGAGSGIGRATAIALLQDGWKVALLGRRFEPLIATADSSGKKDSAMAIGCDVSSPASVKSAFARIISTFGRIDFLFNNAGAGNPAGDFLEWTPEQWQTVISVNLNGVFYCLQEAFRAMKSQSPMGGRIVNNASISAMTPRPNSMAYTASKHAVTGLTKAASLDGRKYDIAVGQINVGNAQSEMAAPMLQGVPQADGRIVSEPVMDVSHVARSVVYMANLPLEANVLVHTIMATKMPFVGRG